MSSLSGFFNKLASRPFETNTIPYFSHRNMNLQSILTWFQLNTSIPHFVASQKQKLAWFVLTVMLLVYLWARSVFWFWTTLVYISWCYVDRHSRKNGGRPIRLFKNSKRWRKIAARFPITLEKMHDLDPNQKYILGYHPHGVASIGALITFGSDGSGFSETFPDIQPFLLSHSTLHYVPLLKELLQSLGVGDVTEESIRYTLRNKGHMAVIVVGGAREALLTHPEIQYLVLKNRKGFVRMAIKTGAHLVPSFGFGETAVWDCAWRVEPGQQLKYWQKLYRMLCGYPPLFAKGDRWYHIFWPKHKPVHVIVGRPIAATRDDNPSQQEIDRLHALYIQELIELFDRHKARFNMELLQLVFVD